MKNTITIIKDGPLEVAGDFRVYDTIGVRHGEEQEKVHLCRCGHSKTKPLCDGSHEAMGFKDACVIDNSKSEELEQDTALIISARPDGMLVARGPMIIIGPDWNSKATRNKAALCRCGQSRNKPFCDISHKKCGFVDDALLKQDTDAPPAEQQTQSPEQAVSETPPAEPDSE